MPLSDAESARALDAWLQEHLGSARAESASLRGIFDDLRCRADGVHGQRSLLRGCVKDPGHFLLGERHSSRESNQPNS